MIDLVKGKLSQLTHGRTRINSDTECLDLICTSHYLHCDIFLFFERVDPEIVRELCCALSSFIVELNAEKIIQVDNLVRPVKTD